MKKLKDFRVYRTEISEDHIEIKIVKKGTPEDKRLEILMKKNKGQLTCHDITVTDDKDKEVDKQVMRAYSKVCQNQELEFLNKINNNYE